MILRGTYTAMITPFKNGEVDYNGLKENIEFQIRNGVDGILLLGTTAETPALSSYEKEKIMEIGIGTVNGRVPVMVGAGSYSTRATVEATQKAKEKGADIALIVTPYYNKPTQEGIYQHFKAVVEETNIPIVVYNIPGRTGRNIEVETMEKLSELPNIIGVKEASGNIDQIMRTYASISSKKNFVIMSGDDNLTFPIMALGGAGVISVASNLIPDRVSRMVNAMLENRIEEARKIHYELLPFFKGIFMETNPSPIKEAMNMCGLPAGDVRLPLVKMRSENREKLREILVRLNILKEQ